MGFITHHAIIVTSWNEDHLHKAKEHAEHLDMVATDIVDSKKNNIRSFMIAPDGSKEGWEDSDIGDKKRALWKNFVGNEKLYVEWVEVNYGHDMEGNDLVTDIDRNHIVEEEA